MERKNEMQKDPDLQSAYLIIYHLFITFQIYLTVPPHMFSYHQS